MIETLQTVLLLLAATSPGDPPNAGEEEFGNRPVGPNEEWAPGVRELVNDDHRVYRRWVNGNEDFYFRGAATELNAALARFAAVRAPTRELFVLPTAGRTSSFEGKEVLFRWRVHAPSGIYLFLARREPGVLATRARMFVHFGGEDAIAPEDLQIPTVIDVVWPHDAVGRLVAATRSASAETRRSAVAALGEHLCMPTAVDALASLCGDDDASVRATALRVLSAGGRSCDRALPALRELAASLDGARRDACRAAVAAIAGATEPDDRARVALARTLESIEELRAQREAESARRARGQRAPATDRS